MTQVAVSTPTQRLTLFRTLHVLVYREEGQAGDLTHGLRHAAMFVGQKVAAEPA